MLGHLAHVLQEFQARYPQIVLDMIVNDAAIDPVKEGFDCALQIFPPRSEELISKSLSGTPGLLRLAGLHEAARHAAPAGDLKGHRIGWYSGYPTRERLAFHGPGEAVSLDLDPVLLTNSVHLLRDYALEHAGIVCVPTLVASDAVLSGALKLVLPEHQLSSFWLSIFYPATVRSSLKLKLFLETLNASFSGVPPWDQSLIDRKLIPAAIIE